MKIKWKQNVYLLLFLFGSIALIFDSCIKDNLSFRQLKGKYDTWRFATFGDTVKINKLPDFSFAGYEKNRDPIPMVPVKAIVEPHTGDNSLMIQEAIDRVSHLPLVKGIRGAVLLKSGTYHVAQTLHIRKSGVVLRGEGQGFEGTILIASRPDRYNLIEVAGAGSGYRQTGKALSPVATLGVAIGSKKIPVKDAGDFSVGDSIVIVKSTDQNWVNFIGMAQYGWSANNYQIPHRRVVKAIHGDTLLVDIPMVDAIEQSMGGGYVATASWPGRISRCGVENLRLQCVYSSDSLDTHAYIAVSLSRTTNSWVRNVTAYYFGFGCVRLTQQSDFNTIQDCAMVKPLSEKPVGSKYSFYIYNGMGNLFQRCYAKEGRYDFNIGPRVTGPNVYLDCYSDNFIGDSGPHFWWSTGTLFDNVVAGVLEARNDGDQGSAHGWTGAQTMFWNCMVLQGLDVQSPPGGVNWAVGCRGPWRNASNAFWNSWGLPVQPRSLFLDQLEKRAGKSAVNNVTVPSQRGVKNIWGELSEWQGKDDPLMPFP